MAKKAPAVEENLLNIQLKADGTMKIERVTLLDGVAGKREIFAEDLADICLAKLEQHIRYSRKSGQQV